TTVNDKPVNRQTVQDQDRSINIDDWIDVKSKLLLSKDEEHVNRSNKLIEAIETGPPCIFKCRSKCYDKINYTKLIFDSYWELGSFLESMNSLLSRSLSQRPRLPFFVRDNATGQPVWPPPQGTADGPVGGGDEL
ncbi:tigger transposable element-derived protein 6-like, partial [Aphis craccivora]